jgi:hypothetical protein
LSFLFQNPTISAQGLALDSGKMRRKEIPWLDIVNDKGVITPISSASEIVAAGQEREVSQRLRISFFSSGRITLLARMWRLDPERIVGNAQEAGNKTL